MQFILFICTYATIEGLLLLLFPHWMRSFYVLLLRALAMMPLASSRIILLILSVFLMSVALGNDGGFAWLLALIAISCFFCGAVLWVKTETRAEIMNLVSNYTNGQFRTVGLMEAVLAGSILVFVILLGDAPG